MPACQVRAQAHCHMRALDRLLELAAMPTDSRRRQRLLRMSGLIERLRHSLAMGATTTSQGGRTQSRATRLAALSIVVLGARMDA